MAKDSNVFARVDSNVKEQAEVILAQLGISMSNAVGMFLRQVVIQKGIPFEIKLPANKPLALGSLSKEQFDYEIEKGLSDVREGRTFSANEVEAELSRNLFV